MNKQDDKQATDSWITETNIKRRGGTLVYTKRRVYLQAQTITYTKQEG